MFLPFSGVSFPAFFLSSLASLSTLLFLFAYHTLGCAPAVTPLRAALVMWLCGACHGVFIDHCSIRYSLDVAAFFAASTCAGAAVMGWTVQYAYERYA